MAIDLSAWEGYRVVWLRPESGRGGADADSSWSAVLEGYHRMDGRRLAEVTLRPEDNDPSRFVQTVERAVLQVLDLPAAADLPGGFSEKWTDLINRINARGDLLVLALEGYDQIGNQDVHELLTELLEYQPESLQILLICQAMPPLPLPRLRVRRALLEVAV